MGADRIGPVLDSLHAAIAVLDPTGRVQWGNDQWQHASRDAGRQDLFAAPIGEDLIAALRASADLAGEAIASGLLAVLEGKASYLEMEYRRGAHPVRWYSLSITPLRGEARGGVLMQREITARAPRDWGREVLTFDDRPARELRARAVDDVAARIATLTGRERDVLALMMRGADNRVIAATLGIGYTTVRSHVRSVIEKLDARSRLEVVAKAYRGGLKAYEPGGQAASRPRHAGADL